MRGILLLLAADVEEAGFMRGEKNGFSFWADGDLLAGEAVGKHRRLGTVQCQLTAFIAVDAGKCRVGVDRNGAVGVEEDARAAVDFPDDGKRNRCAG